MRRREAFWEPRAPWRHARKYLHPPSARPRLFSMKPTSRTSAVEFPTPTRLHVAVAVRDVAAAIPFYRTLFGQEPTKVRADYAKFEVLDPPVNFSLNNSEVGAGHGAGPAAWSIFGGAGLGPRRGAARLPDSRSRRVRLAV